MELFFNAKFDFKSTLNCDLATSHHTHLICQSPAGDTVKLTMFGQVVLEQIVLLKTGTGVLGNATQKEKLFRSIIKKTFYGLSIFNSLAHKIIYVSWGPFLIV